MVELKNAVFDENGKVRSFTQFRASAANILDKYNELWLEAEYEAVVRGTVMGRKWLDIQRDKDLYPYLVYVTAGDERVRLSHQALEGITLPVDSPFWQQYYPPNGWRCRCTVKQVQKAEDISDIDASMKLAAKDTPKYWRKNTGENLIFEENKTAYFKDFPRKQLDAQQHYNLKDLATIYDKANLSDLPEEFADKDSFNEWVSKLSVTHDYEGMPLTTSKKLFEKTINKGRWQEARFFTDTITKPDEVWYTEQSGMSKEVFKVYLKYYKHKPAIVLATLDGAVQSFYRWDGNLSEFEKFRRGILQKK